MYKLCIVVPCYNEALRLDGDRYIEALKKQSNFSVCFVNDGSNDNTSDVLLALTKRLPEQISMLHLETNLGKAAAVRLGILENLKDKEFHFIGFLDADLSTPLEELKFMMEILLKDHDIVIGSRIKRLGATVERELWRHITGRFFATFVSNILRLPVYDSQCGAKLFKREFIASLFQEPFKTDWLFDVEILFRARNMYGKEFVLKKIMEYPLHEWVNVGGSKLKLRHFMKVPFQLFKIHYYYNYKALK